MNETKGVNDETVEVEIDYGTVSGYFVRLGIEIDIPAGPGYEWAALDPEMAETVARALMERASRVRELRAQAPEIKGNLPPPGPALAKVIEEEEAAHPGFKALVDASIEREAARAAAVLIERGEAARRRVEGGRTPPPPETTAEKLAREAADGEKVREEMARGQRPRPRMQRRRMQ